ncbi:hypothetical protein [Piscinibacter sakaiensis]|uniref:Uncharacterized protein n=1 Tax=Piscinibacter sakaiensis TaxID=1547922 RepID=A0A0K8P520_PISS1|nr:hypothetical protein [Piscinibacter sakaiensis]GAP37290.1 hypothetical protein ISF6_3145 [Piscinibacter sakaiensis]
MLLLLGAGAPAAFAQGAPGDTGGIVFRPSQARVSAERLRLPGGERLGLVGTAYTVELGQGLAFGPAVFGSVSGNRGGLFTLGAELAWRARLWGPLRTELGVYAGGGGGAALPVGDGLMLRPHADLLYDFGGISLGLSWSQVRFAGTPISSRQVGLVLSTDTDFTYLPRDRQGLALPSIGRPGAGFDRVQGVLGVYRPRGDAGRSGGGALPRSIGYTGLRAERALRGPFYWGLEANVGTQGGVTGYVEYLGTVGVEAGLPDSVFSVGGRVALGMAGGGDIAVGGGLLAKASAYGAVRLTRDLAATVEFGLTSAPRGDFRALHGAASLIWIFDDAGNVFSPSRTTRTEFATGLERIDAARRDGSTRPLTTVVLKASRFLDANLYVTGQARSAVGGGAGGWSAGLFGVGWQQPMGTPGRGPTWHVGVEALAGAGGGGGVDARGGALLQPNAYVGIDLGPTSALRIGAGQLRARRGELKSTTVDVSLVFAFGLVGPGAR